MTEFELLTKMALTIKRTIDAADDSDSAMLGVKGYPAELCTLPKHLRRDLGECLDDLLRVKKEGE